MISTYSQLRAKGRADLKGRWAEAAMFTFVCILVTIFVSSVGSVIDLVVSGPGPSAVYISGASNTVDLICRVSSGWISTIFSLLVIPMVWSFSVAFLDNHRGENHDPFGPGRLFVGYKDFWRVFSTLFLYVLLVILFLLLCVIPGIWMALCLAMVPFILRDYPELGCIKVLQLSADMMVGYKWKYFLLSLTFLGWILLCILTLGIGFFWLCPYMEQTAANFYEEVKAEYEGVQKA